MTACAECGQPFAFVDANDPDGPESPVIVAHEPDGKHRLLVDDFEYLVDIERPARLQ